MAKDKLTTKEHLTAVVMRPRSAQRCYEQVECGESARDVNETIEVSVQKKEDGDATK